MNTRLGQILEQARGSESRVKFARRLGLSYTFVRSMEMGERHPSDKVLVDIAQRLGLDAAKLLIATYSDRSAMLADVLRARGVLTEQPEPAAAANKAREPATNLQLAESA